MNPLKHPRPVTASPSPRAPSVSPPLPRRLLAKFLANAPLAAIVIGSGIAAQQLSPGNVGLQPFENAAATATGLFAIILMFGPVSAAHFNPAISRVDASFGGISRRDVAADIPAQATGCITGAWLAAALIRALYPHVTPPRPRGSSSRKPTSPIAARASDGRATMRSSPPDPTRRGAD